MTARDELHALVDKLSDDDTNAALAYVRQLAHGSGTHPLMARERLARRMGPAAVTGAAFMAQAPTSLATLAEQQGVRPVRQFEHLLADVWPEDEDIDVFTATLRRWRHENGDGHDDHDEQS